MVHRRHHRHSVAVAANDELSLRVERLPLLCLSHCDGWTRVRDAGAPRTRGRAREKDVGRRAALDPKELGRVRERAGKRIELTAKEFALLELLLRRQGEVLPKSLIASQVWDMNFDSDTNVIEVAIRRLRAKVDEGFAAPLIHTVRGMGYVLEARA